MSIGFPNHDMVGHPQSFCLRIKKINRCGLNRRLPSNLALYFEVKGTFLNKFVSRGVIAGYINKHRPSLFRKLCNHPLGGNMSGIKLR